MPALWRSAGPIILAIPIFGIAWTCHDGPEPITQIEIVPPEVQVGFDPGTTTFKLEARIWTGPPDERLTAKASTYGPLQWSDNQSWLAVQNSGPLGAVVTIDPGATGSPGPGEVTLQVDGETAKAKITIAHSSAVGEDQLTADYAAGKTPDAVTVNGVMMGASGDCKVSLFAFVRRSRLGNVGSPCTGDREGWEAAVLDVDHQLVFPQGGWTPSADPSVDAGSLQQTVRTVSVALRAMVGSTSLSDPALVQFQDDVLARARAELIHASSALAEARAGFQLVELDPKAIRVKDPVEIGTCSEGDLLTAGSDMNNVLNVYYVNGLYGLRGRICPWQDERPQDVIYVAWSNEGTTTLVHELGHAFGLTLPGHGHSDLLAGFDAANVMTGGDNDRDPLGRRRFSVGQVFRMNGDSSSWLHRSTASGTPAVGIAATGLDCQCGADDPVGRCPTVVADPAPPSQAPKATDPPECSDLLRLLKVSDTDDESPLALVAGRRWRVPLGAAACRFDHPGETEWRSPQMFVRLDNLTHPGLCDSWAVIFFRRHGPQFVEIPKSTWTQSANKFLVGDAMPPPVEFEVQVYYTAGQPGHGDAARDDILHAQETFGEISRTGLTLSFVENTAAS
ncbi:MAG TPA: hypothetical protein VFY42_01975, partial [Gemmatimonadales bacterium]|nr:hypothetical protein [Gemmatimonadales bacterium]